MISTMGQILTLEKLRRLKTLTVCHDTEGRLRKKVCVTDGVEKSGVYF